MEIYSAPTTLNVNLQVYSTSNGRGEKFRKSEILEQIVHHFNN